MDAVRTFLENQSLFALFLTIALGYLIGEINIKGVALGSGAVLFVGLAVGAFAPKSAPPALLGTLGLLFFLAWTLVYLGVWAVHPAEAFRGLGPRPRFADFFYYSVSTALISPPGDILAQSRGARGATMIEMLIAFALLTAYLSSFVDWGRRE